MSVNYLLLATLGRLLALLPDFFPAGLARFFGWLVYVLPIRREVVLSNLHHAFPERSEAWRRKVALESCRRMVEMGLFVLASPYFSEERIRKMFRADKSLSEGSARVDQSGAPGVILVPHFSLMESLTLIRVIYPELPRGLEVGVFYRPFGNASLERWVKQTRERFAIRLLSRKKGFGEANGILRRNGRVAVLFDQHPGKPGALSVFLDRLVLTSELAGLFAEKHGAKAFAFYVERTGFWRGVVKSELVCDEPLAETVTIRANAWLEEKMRGDDNLCADWLWAHKRWKVNDESSLRFCVRARRDVLAESLQFLGKAAAPRNERFWIRLPEEVSSAESVFPLVARLRAARFDAAITFLAEENVATVAKESGLAERVIVLPRAGRRKFFRRLRQEYPDTLIVLTETAEGDREAKLTGAPQRMGMVRPGEKRRDLTHCWTLPADQLAKEISSEQCWEAWWEACGLPKG